MSEQRAASSEQARHLIVLLLLVAICSLIAVTCFFFHRDNLSTHYPLKFISTASFRAGEIPFWNFYDGGGQPLAGNPNTLTFYPDNFLYLLLPAHVAFNLHFLIHLIAGWMAMRALTACHPEPRRRRRNSEYEAVALRDPSTVLRRLAAPAAQDDTRASAFAAWLYVLSGIAISAMSFYSLITAIALVPFAFLAIERRSAVQLGLAFGLMALAGEPVTIVATAIGCAIAGFGRLPLRSIAAIPLAFVVALPQLIAYGEVVREVERGAHRYSAATALSASLDPMRLLEIVFGPLLKLDAPHLFPTLFLGVIVIPAVMRRSRYTLVAAVMLFLALGAYNPIVRAAVESFDVLRIGRYPEKFALPMCVALAVLAGAFFRDARARAVWMAVTFIPLIAWAVVTVPIDWWAPYRVRPVPQPVRIFRPQAPGGQEVRREDYRLRARRLDPLFGATAGIRYAVDRSPDGMFSILTRIAAERFAATRDARWLRIAGCSNIPGALPRAMFVPRATGAASIAEVVRAIEDPRFDEHAAAVAPPRLAGFLSPPAARVTAVVEHPQSLEISVSTPAPALLLVNETYFRGWVARAGDRDLETMPLDLDRLGVMVPAGQSTVVLRFGRHRAAVVAAWVLSSIALIALLFALRVEKLDGRAGEVERPSDEDRSLP